MSKQIGRIKGNNRTEVIKPEVELMSMTQWPIGTLFSLWHGSRNERRVKSNFAERIYRDTTLSYEFNYDNIIPYREVVDYIAECYPEHTKKLESGIVDVRAAILEIARMNIKANVPSCESLSFNFMIDNATVAFREQLVRGKLNGQFWTQTSRTADLTSMDVNMSEKIETYGGKEATRVYEDTVEVIRLAYKQLQELGVPTEEIRLAPEARTHRIYWMVNIRSLMAMFARRTDWMCQATLWTPIIEGVVEELRYNGLEDLLDLLVKPEVKIENGKVVFHKYDNENEDRYYGRDPQPVDPLWLAYKGLKMPEHTDLKFYDEMKKSFMKVWTDEYLEVLGWDRNNPDKLGPYDRP